MGGRGGEEAGKSEFVIFVGFCLVMCCWTGGVLFSVGATMLAGL